MMVPDSILNTKVTNRQADQRAEKEQAMQLASRKTNAEETTAAAAKSPAQKEADKEKFEETHPKTENMQQGYADAIRNALTNGRDPNTDPQVRAWKSAIAAEQKPPTAKHSPGEIKLDEGIPTGVYGDKDKLYRAGDPNLPPELKAALDDANTAHKQARNCCIFECMEEVFQQHGSIDPLQYPTLVAEELIERGMYEWVGREYLIDLACHHDFPPGFVWEFPT